MRPALALSLLAGCLSGARTTTTRAPLPSAQASAEARAATSERAELPCADGAIVVERGVERGAVCPGATRGLAIVDLADAWTPRLFAPEGSGAAPAYRATYLALAAERDPSGKALADEDALGELYGVVPSLAVVRARLADDARHACHAQIDSAPIALLDKPYAQDHKDEVAAAERTRVALAAQVERLRARGREPDAATAARLAKLEALHAGLLAAQGHLACEGALAERDVDGSMTWRTANAVELFQRRNFLMPNERLDPETREALATDSRELDYRLALRILRERVVDATGLVEDGTAGSGPAPVLGRLLDPQAMREARGAEAPLPNAAPDLVSAATEAAAKELGWTDPAAVAAFLARHPHGARVALALPPAPAYHSAAMNVFAEIDRGDVWYDDAPVPRRIAHRPTLVLYVDDGGTRRALVRWPTTIGGWADQRLPSGELVQRWKESDVGPRVWRDLYAAPTWLPPKTTPDRDLVKNLWNGHWALKSEVLGPGPHAAYGMTLLVHHQVFHTPRGDRFDENGIGTHGSASVTSIVNGTSHGCHRLYNQLAVRLADFLLAHRAHVVRGEQPERYRRIVSYRGTFVAAVTTRGFLYELTPPVPITVLPGNIRTARKVPPRASAAARP